MYKRQPLDCTLAHSTSHPRLTAMMILFDFNTLVQAHSYIILTIVLAKNPVPVRCPVAGKFNFTQKGDVPFETRILGGVTLSPRPNVYCKENISDFSVCDTQQKEILIDENYCLSVDRCV